MSSKNDNKLPITYEEITLFMGRKGRERVLNGALDALQVMVVGSIGIVIEPERLGLLDHLRWLAHNSRFLLDGVLLFD